MENTEVKTEEVVVDVKTAQKRVDVATKLIEKITKKIADAKEMVKKIQLEKIAKFVLELKAAKSELATAVALVKSATSHAKKAVSAKKPVAKTEVKKTAKRASRKSAK